MDEITDKIYQECCVAGMSRLPDECVDLAVTSPPYDDLREYRNRNEWNYEFFKRAAAQLVRTLKPGGVIVWNVNDATVNGKETLSSFRQALYFCDELGMGMHDTMLYQKTGVAFASGVRSVRYTQKFEYVFVLSKGRPKSINLIADKENKYAGAKSWGEAGARSKDGVINKTGRKTRPVRKYGVRDNIWMIKNSGGFGQSCKEAYQHPATMPEELARGHILSWSSPGDLVLDPFLGSGTTARMASREGRHYLGYEIDAGYYALAKTLIGKENRILEFGRKAERKRA